mgnify:FL=1
MGRKKIWLPFIACVGILVACSGGEHEQTTKDKQEVRAVEAKSIATEEVIESTKPIQDLAVSEVIAEARNVAQHSTAHEGIVKAYEQWFIGDVLQTQYFETTYEQDESIEGERGGHMLHYSQQISTDEMEARNEYYINPSVVEYKYYGEINEWISVDLEFVDPEYTERVSYLSPADFLAMAEKYLDTIEVLRVDEESYVIEFVPTEEDLEELISNSTEPESYLFKEMFAYEYESPMVALTFSPTDFKLVDALFFVTFQNTGNEGERMELSAEQHYNSYSLTNEISPPAKAFEQTGIFVW